MRLLLILILLFLFFLRKKKEYFCSNTSNEICKFTKIILPIEKTFTLPETKIYGESWAQDIYNLLFNPNYTITNKAIENNYTLEKYLLEVCYFHKTEVIDGIMIVLNKMLKEKYDYNNNDLLPITKNDTVKSYFIKLRHFRYKLLGKIFDEQSLIDGILVNNAYEVLNLSLLKFHIFYLLLDEQNEYYINNNLRYGIYLYLYEKNVFEIKKEYHNEIYQYILIAIKDVLKRYIKLLFDNENSNFEEISIKKIRNLLINNSIIDYNIIKKDLCYI